MRLASDFASEHALELQQGKMMVEVRSAGHDKGSGIAALMSMQPFQNSLPLFLGDDLTDEPGFRRCAELGGAESWWANLDPPLHSTGFRM